MGQRGGLVFMCLMSGVLCAGIRHSCATSSSSMDGANMHSGASLRMAPPICSTEEVRVLPPTRRALQFATVSNLVVSPTSTWRFTSEHAAASATEQMHAAAEKERKHAIYVAEMEARLPPLASYVKCIKADPMFKSMRVNVKKLAEKRRCEEWVEVREYLRAMYEDPQLFEFQLPASASRFKAQCIHGDGH